jgi:arylsulfatase
MIGDLTSLVPERPFFLYLAFGAMHSPHQAPQEYLEKYRGKFDAGWDVVREEWFARQKELGVIPHDTKLAPHNPGVRPWAELSTNEQRFAARLQEAFAAMLEHTDRQIGRLVDFLKSIGQWDNTLFIVMSDNGASQEGGATGVLDEMRYFNGMRESVDQAVLRLDDIGGPNSHCNIPWGWAQAGNTPLKWYKQNTHGGGVRDPLIMHWPAGLKAKGETRDQFCHAIDIAPTILDVLGIATPEVVAGVPQMPVDGVSLKPSFADPAAWLKRGPQYFEMLGHRGIWKDGWKAVTHHTPGKSFDDDRWELYHLAKDFSEYDDLAEKEPDKLKEMIDLWWSEADENGVLPLDDRSAVALFRSSMRPGMPMSRNRFIYHPPVSHIVADTCPSVARGWTTTIFLDHPAGDADGALVARGSLNSGFAIYIKDGRLTFDYNEFHHHTRAASQWALSPGSHEVSLKVLRTAEGGGDVSLSVDGQVVSTTQIPKLLFMISSTGMDIGRSLSPITEDYAPPFVYPGRIAKVVFETPQSPEKGEVKAQVRAEMTRQ